MRLQSLEHLKNPLIKLFRDAWPIVCDAKPDLFARVWCGYMDRSREAIIIFDDVVNQMVYILGTLWQLVCPTGDPAL